MSDFRPDCIVFPTAKGFSVIIDSVDEDLSLVRWQVFKRASGYMWVRRNTTIKMKRIHYTLAREIMKRILGRELEAYEIVDHIDLNPLNNTRSNLRLATKSQNTINTGLRKTNKSGFKGVCFHKDTQKWEAQIGVNGKRLHLGLYSTPEAAAEAYRIAAVKYHGEFARLD